MNENFDRAPGAGRTRNHVPADPGFAVVNTGDGDTKSTLFNQREPLRQPRTSPPFGESNTAGGACSVLVGAGRKLTELKQLATFRFDSCFASLLCRRRPLSSLSASVHASFAELFRSLVLLELSFMSFLMVKPFKFIQANAAARKAMFCSLPNNVKSKVTYKVKFICGANIP